MTSRFRSYRAVTAFTLIELLTVIAIIGILAAIIIPVTSKVRSSARQAACGSNLRQIGAACLLYTQDNKGYYPPPKVLGYGDFQNNWMYWLIPYAVSGSPRPGSWAELVQRMNTGVLHCPATDPSDTSVVQAWVSYKFNYNFFLKGQAIQIYNYGPTATVKSLTVGMIASPSKAYMVADGWQGDVVFSSPNDASIAQGIRSSVHGGKANILFADGHVQALTQAQLTADWATGYSNITN